ncbi:MAG: HAMP domain-containing histidine kinase [Actinobacteria bacterium]|nr:HAMP domain-containing histidine kinase [Actinomycetota bacterium]
MTDLHAGPGRPVAASAPTAADDARPEPADVGTADAVGSVSTEAEPAAKASAPRKADLRGTALHLQRRAIVRGRQAARGAARLWQASLQLRVATTTVLVTGVLVLIIGVFLLDQIGAGVLRAKRTAAISQAELGLGIARQQLAGVEPGDISGITTAIQTATTQLGTNGSNAGLYTVQIGTTNKFVSTLLNEQITVSPQMRRVVQHGDLAVQYARIPRADGGSGTQSGLIVGAPISVRPGLFELYYFFPLTAEQSTLDIVQRTVLIAGLSLVILVAAIALIVTRQVVRPVRVAARTAEQLAAGDLARRIKVQGTDDIARLGRSFNDMAASLQRQFRRLEELSRLQRRFTSDVSHELRTPLTTIRMAAELLHSERAEFAPELGRSVELLRTELDRFEALLADLLEISRYDAGVARLESELVDLRSVVSNSVDASRGLAMRHGSELVIDVPHEAVVVEVDARRIERILRNLVNNALDHGEGLPVTVRLAAGADSVAVTVRDVGVGLRPGEAGLVFNRFWRGDPSRSRITGGTGLGLSIALEDARLHGGWLQAWGERGRGAQFRLTLPRRIGGSFDDSPLDLEPVDDPAPEIR